MLRPCLSLLLVLLLIPVATADEKAPPTPKNDDEAADLVLDAIRAKDDATLKLAADKLCQLKAV